MKTLRIATRASELALAQTQIVIDAVKRVKPDIVFDIIEIKTRGDIDKKNPLFQVFETGFFTTAIEETLHRNEADIAIHSYKDLPIALSDGLVIAAVLDRRFCEDCLVCREKVRSVNDLPQGAKVGTSSLRREAQLLRMRPDLQCEPIRGNVPTRIEMLERGDYDAVILARAGLERLGMAEKISFCFDPTKFIPAPAQGAIAVQARAGGTEIIKLFELFGTINDKNSRITSDTERLVFHALGAGCHAPAGVFAQISGDDIVIHAVVSNDKGENVIERQITGPVSSSAALAADIAKQLLDAGASEILSNE